MYEYTRGKTQSQELLHKAPLILFAEITDKFVCRNRRQIGQQENKHRRKSKLNRPSNYL